MFMRRCCSLLLALFLIFSATCGGAYAVDSLEDIIGKEDLWDEFNSLPSVDDVFPSAPPIDYDPLAGEGGEGDIMPISLPEDSGVYFRIWQTSPSVSNASNSYYVFQDQRYLVSSGAVSGSAANRLRQSQYEVAFVDSAASPIITPSMATSSSAPVIGYMAYGAITRQATSAYDYQGISNSPYGTVVHFSNLALDKYDGSTLAVYGYFISDLKVGHTYVKDSSTFYSLYGSSPTVVDISWSFDGETFSPLPDGSTYDFSTGLLSLEVPIDSIVTDFYISLSFSASKYYASNTSTVSKDTGILFYKLDVSELTIKAVAGQQGGVDAETKGLLGTIISWLTSIRDGIVGVATSIAELPGKIVTVLLDGLKSLFVPNAEDLQELKEKYQTLLETKFGFIYQSFQMLENLFNTIVGAWGSHSDYTFEFPGISFDLQGQTMVLAQPQVISLDNELMTVLRNFAGTVVSLICVLALVHSMETLFIAIVSGKNYFDYLAMVRQAEEEVAESQ